MMGYIEEKLVGRYVTGVRVSEDKEEVVLSLTEGMEAVFTTEGDCCSNTWVEHINAPDFNAPALITGTAWPEMPEATEEDYETIQYYRTDILTTAGAIEIEYRNSSNGYYGGSLLGPQIRQVQQ